MRIAISILILLLLCQCLAVAQVNHKRENVWAFGNKGGMDFNGGAPVQILTSSWGYNGASICDTNGQLLFYTSGSEIWDRNHNPMPYGGNLFFPMTRTSQSWWLLTWRNHSGAMIVPIPGSKHRYYVFSMTQRGNPGPVPEPDYIPYVGRLYYSIVNMELNGGLGDVEPGQKLVLIDSLLSATMTTVAGNRCNIWLLTSTRGSTDTFAFRAYEITETGINLTPVLSDMNIPTIPTEPGAQYDHMNSNVMKVSSDRQKILIPGVRNTLYNFNSLTGKVAFDKTLPDLPYLNHSYKFSHSAVFSPDNSKVYTHTARGSIIPGIPYTVYVDSIYQFDLKTGKITTLTGTSDKNSYPYFLKVGPDGKVYMQSALDSVGCINSPNLSGLICDYKPNVLYMGPYAFVTINFGQTGEVSFVEKRYPTRKDTIVSCFKDSAVLQIDTTAFDIQWYHGSTTHNITVAQGTYIVTYRTPPCNYHTDTFVVHITPKFRSGSLYKCRALHNGMAFIQPDAGSTDTYTYTWSDSTGKLLQQHTTTGPDTLFHLSQGNYTVRMQALSGCDTIIRIRVSPDDSTSRVSFNANTVACTYAPVQFNNTSTPGFISYVWDFGDNTHASVGDPNHTYLQPGNYAVTLIGTTVTPCYDTASTVIQINPPVVIELGADTFLCKPTALQLQPVGDNSYSYLWKPATAVDNPVIKKPVFISNTTQTLILEATNSYGCKASDTITIVVDTTAALKVNDTFICLGDTVQLNATGAATYHWVAGSAYINDTTIANPFVSPKHHHPYMVIGTKVSGCIDTAIAMVKVDSASSISFVMDREEVCQDQYVNFTPVYRHGGIKDLLWNIGGTSAVQGWYQKYRFDGSGTFIVTVTAHYAVCPDSTYSDTIVVHPYPVVNLGPDTFICPNGASIMLTNLAPSIDQYTYWWSTGETTHSITVKQPNVYYLTVTSGHGCSTTDSILIERSCYIDIPNAFTPNGDGVNDYFFPRELLSHNVSKFHMQVFNRWGQVIFETDKIDGRGWDGSFNHVPQPEGVYVYLIVAMIDNVYVETFKGNVSLLR